MQTVNHKRTLYVGGLAEEVCEPLLRAAFIPFGEIVQVEIPLDHASQKNRGFGFVEFEEVEDAAAAMDNMHEAELYGRILTVNIAKPNIMSKYKAVWEQQADQWDLDEKPTSEKSEGKAEMSEQAGKPTTSDTVENAETTKAD